MESQLETTQTVSALKLFPILKIGDYDLWSMRMEQYLTHTDYALWEVIVNGDAPAVASASAEVISQENANLKLLRSLPSAWNNITLIMRNKSDLDTMSMDVLYNNLKVYEAEIKGQSSSRSNSQIMAFGQASSLTYVDDVMFSFFANQSNSLQLDNKDLEQIDIDDLEEMDLKWQVAMLTMSVEEISLKKEQEINLNFMQKIVGFDKTKVECYNCHRRVAKDKAGLGYDSQMNESEVVNSVFNSKESDVDDILMNLSIRINVTKSGQVLVNAAIQSSPRAAASISTARPVNIAAPKSKDKGFFEQWMLLGILQEQVHSYRLSRFDGGFVPFAESPKEKNNVLFTETECLVLSPDFKLLDESQVLLKVPRQNNMYSFDLKNVVPLGRSGPEWLFDIDLQTNSMNYEPVTAGNQTNKNAGIKDNVDSVPLQQIFCYHYFNDMSTELKDQFSDELVKGLNEETSKLGEKMVNRKKEKLHIRKDHNV
ncbi:hypothetical protein Tco_1144297 [Tanacetum coccineum]